MDLKDKIDELKEVLESLLGRNLSESNTQSWLINPFLKSLGYNTNEPGLVHHQFNADPNDSKTGKVDYAILQNERPIIFIEAKKLHESLDSHVSQIRRYFNNVREVDFAILTNGNEYRFYTDLNHKNMLDDEPFLWFKLNDVDEELIHHLGQFSRLRFDSGDLKALAKKVSIRSKTYSYLEKQFSSPSDPFVTFISKEVFSTSRQAVRGEIQKALPGVFSNLKAASQTISTTNPSPEEKTISPPNEYQSIFEIGSVTHTTLDSFRFQNRSFDGYTWTSMFALVMKSLYQKDAQKLISICKKRKSLKITSERTSIRHPKPIGDGLFVSSYSSTETKVQWLRYVLSGFDMDDSLLVKLGSVDQ